ncbi:hypothetical protein I5T93_09200 [Stenotrophomonas maltophilia]|nr:hypothetical protein [Stenotrophomonas maltophilia]
MNYSIKYAQTLSELEIDKFDLAILAVTGESRSWCIAEKFKNSNSPTWVLARKNENLTVVELDKEIERRIPNAGVVLAQSFASSLRAFFSAAVGRVNVFVDVSCMTRMDMATAFEHMFALDGDVREVSVTIGYVISEFTPPPAGHAPNEHIKPISSRFAGWPDDPHAPTALVLGLGYEAAKAEGASEYFDAQEGWVFSPQSPISKFDVAVINNNRQIVDRAAREGRLVEYRVDDPADAIYRMNSLAIDLAGWSNPLILPFGPKLFAALSLLVAVANPSVGVWHATGDTDLPADDHVASQHLVIVNVLLERPHES